MKASIILRTERKYADGSSPFALCVHLGVGRKVVLGLGGLSGRAGMLDAKGFVKGRDQAARDINMELQRQLSRANEILIKARLADMVMDPEGFKAEWLADGGSQDFIAWSEKELARQYRVQLIGYSTRKQNASVLNKLKRFAPDGLRFSAINQDFLEEFDGWHRKELRHERRAIEDGRTARIKSFKSIRKFLYAAKRAGVFTGKNPFGDFKLPKGRNSLTYLTRSELALIRAHYDDGNHVEELRPFLFACYTGLRFSDVATLDRSHIQGGRILKPMFKGSQISPKMVDVWLTRPAQEMIANGGLPMVIHTDQHINRTLKQVAAATGIAKRVTFHVARHSFATLFLEAGGSVEVLKELLGHGSLSVTMAYVHVAGERKQSQMAMMEAMLGADHG
jgi:integrase/recombinase XerD